MSNTQNYLLACSLVGWFIIAIAYLVRNKRRKGYWIASVIQIFAILAIAKLLNRYLGFFSDIQDMGMTTIGESLTLLGLYFSMVLGIIAHHIFVQVQRIEESYKTGRRKRIRWFPMIMPLVISPIIFLAVLSLLQSTGKQATTPIAVVTQCILAFQNGFFWKSIYGQIQKNMELKQSERSKA